MKSSCNYCKSIHKKEEYSEMEFTLKEIDNTNLETEAREFLTYFYQANNLNGFKFRWSEVEKNIRKNGTYWHTKEELTFGAKLAWRNSNRCIGRLFWKTLKVLDYRRRITKDAFIDGIKTHLRIAQATNKIRSTISIFPPLSVFKNASFKILNYTLIQYAGYRLDDGQIVGDPKHIAFTKLCHSLGWIGEGTSFDILPIVFKDKTGATGFIELPKSLVKEINITHPTLPFFKSLGLRWYNLPIISNMKLEIGGITYPTAPFNGWYMLNEIATRNFGDKSRYNVLPIIASKMGVDSNSPFWKDKALLAINEAVYYSFNKAGVTIVDHHTAAEQFMKFVSQECDNEREVTGDWSWLIPPTAPSTTAIFHHKWNNSIRKPNFFPNEEVF